MVCTGDDETVSVCAPLASCGDGMLDAVETCDDGDTRYDLGESCTDDCTKVPCGQPVHPEADGPSSSDALFTLRAAVGTAACDLAVCDVDGSSSVSTVDALRVLKKAVEPSIGLECPS